MDNKYSSLLAVTYLCNVFSHNKDRKSKAARNLVEWIQDRADWSLPRVLEGCETSDEIRGKDLSD